MEYQEELKRVFTSEEQRALLSYGLPGHVNIYVAETIRRKDSILVSNKIGINPSDLLEEVYKNDGSFDNLQKYINFRKNDLGIDYSEAIAISLREYIVNRDLFNEIEKNIRNLPESEVKEIKAKYDDLMSVDNKFGIKTYDDFLKKDDLEKKYYKKEAEQRKVTRIERLKKYISNTLSKGKEKDIYISQIHDKSAEVNSEEALIKIVSLLEKIRDTHDYKELRKCSNEFENILGMFRIEHNPDNNPTIENLIAMKSIGIQDTKRTDVDLIRVRNLKNEKKVIKSQICAILTNDSDIETILKLANGRNKNMVQNSDLNSIINILNEINEIDSLDELEELFNKVTSMIGTKELSDFRGNTSHFKEKLMEEYESQFSSVLTRHEQEQPQEGMEVKIVDGVKVVELKGAPFKHIVHCGDISENSDRCCATYITDMRRDIFNPPSSNLWVFDNFRKKSIKEMAPCDSGFGSSERYKYDFITPENLESTISTRSKEVRKYTEITLSTNESKPSGGDKLEPSAIWHIHRGSGSCDLSEMARIAKESGQDVIYVMYEDVYKKKQDERDQDVIENLDKYIELHSENMDTDVLNQILISARGDEYKLKMIFEKMADQIRQNGFGEKVDINAIRTEIERIDTLKNTGYDFLEDYEEILRNQLKVMSKKRSIDDIINSVISISQNERTRKRWKRRLLW